MNIAFFCDAYRPTRSGVAVSVDTTAAELRARGHHVVIFAPRYKNYQDSDDDVIRFAAGHWFLAKDFPVAWPFLPRLSLNVERRFRYDDFDIVHSHSPFVMGTAGVRWARRWNLPVVFTFHTLYHHYLHYSPLPHGVSRSYTLWRVASYCRACDHIIVPSKPIERIVRRFNAGVPISAIPTGIKLDRFSQSTGSDVRARYQIGADEIVLLYVGRLVREKSLDFLMRAVAPLLRGETLDGGESVPPVRLMLVGDGPLSATLQELAEQLQISQQVIFTGFVDSAQVANYYRASDIFTFASRTETQGVSIAEALATGLPCVVVGAMGAAQAVTNGHDGFVVPPHEVPFRHSVERLVQNEKLRAAMSANARQSAYRLSLEHSVDKLLSLYDGLLQKAAFPHDTVSST